MWKRKREMLAKRKKKFSVLEWGIQLVDLAFPSTFDPEDDPCFSKLDKSQPAPKVSLTKKEQWLMKKKGLLPPKPVASSVGLVIPDQPVLSSVPKHTVDSLLQKELDMEEVDRRTEEMDRENPGSGSMWRHKILQEYQTQQRIEVAKTFAKASTAERLAMSSGGHAYMSGMDVFSHAAFEGSEFLSDLGNIPCSRLDGQVGPVMESVLVPVRTSTKPSFKQVYTVVQEGDAWEGKTCPITWDVFAKGDSIYITLCCQKAVSSHAVDDWSVCPLCHFAIGDLDKPK